MRRRLFNLAAALSLLLFLAAAALWVRSLTHFEQVYFTHVSWPAESEQRALYVTFAWYSSACRLDVMRIVRRPEFFDTLRPAEYASYRAHEQAGMRWPFNGRDVTIFMNPYLPGFEFRHHAWNNMGQRRWGFALAVRPWLPALLAAVLPALWLHRWRKSRQAGREGLCPTCGYDLRATSDRCPECGTPASAAVTAVTP